MANFVKCPNGHMYDPDIHAHCPHCRNVAPLNVNTAPADFPGSAATGGFESVATQPMSDGESPITLAKTEMFQGPAVGGGLTPCVTAPGILRQPGISLAKNGETFNPVVGWLIVTSGADKGKDFKLQLGKNVIGRGGEATVSLNGGDNLSRVHATVFYYPKVNQFYIEDHSTHGTYLNGKPVVQRTILSSMDQIEVDNAKLILKAFCDDAFCWEEFK